MPGLTGDLTHTGRALSMNKKSSMEILSYPLRSLGDLQPG
ncbi:conserved hypothetical protein [delta proteobacterium NaphS2]|nr:conserved hypothetical protein [delta proteobacterium NaphS2]